MFNDAVSAVALNQAGHRASGNCISSGWGNTFPYSAAYSKGSDELMRVTVAVISDLECLANYPVFGKQRATAICAKSKFFGLIPKPAGTCQGDSGGPMVCYEDFAKKTGPYLAGVVSCKKTLKEILNLLEVGYCKSSWTLYFFYNLKGDFLLVAFLLMFTLTFKL